MKFVYHLGAHFTDDDRLLRCLFKNQAALAGRGTAVPRPNQYRPQLRAAILELRGAPAPGDRQGELLREFALEDGIERVVFSHAAFLGVAGVAVSMGRFYPNAGEFVQSYANLFPDDETEFFLSLRDPATFIPAVFAQSGENSVLRFLGGEQPTTLHWSEAIGRMQRACPNAKITVWCNEDSPVIWHDLLSSLAGIDPVLSLRGSYEFPGSLLDEKGQAELRSRLRADPPKTAPEKRALLRALLENHAKPEEMEEEISLPGWTQEMMDALSAQYDADLERISKIDGITLLTP